MEISTPRRNYAREMEITWNICLHDLLDCYTRMSHDLVIDIKILTHVDKFSL